MPTALTRYKVLLSAPGDAEQECKAVDEELEKINRTHSNETGIDFYPTDWRRDSRADSGDEPQKLLNRQIVEDADIILAIFKERFGTPTSQYGSGTEEEIMLGLEMGKPVLVYFWNPGPDFTPKDADQYAKIAALRSRLQSRVMYQVFSDEAALRNKITHDFTKLLYELEDGTTSPKPQLSLAGVNADDEITDGSVSVINAVVSSMLNAAAYDEPVRTAYESVLAIELPKQEAVSYSEAKKSFAAASISPGLSERLKQLSGQLTPHAMAFPSNPIEITEETRLLVVTELASLGIDASDSIFDLGKLRESGKYMPAGISSSEKMLFGSDEEKGKYEALKTLIRKCEQRHDFAAFLKSNAHVGAIALVIKNDGGSPAHHVNVDLAVTEASFLHPNEIVAPSDSLMAYGIETQDNCERLIAHLFELGESVSYKPYEDARVRTESRARIPPTLISPPVNPLYGMRYLKPADFDELVDYEFGDYRFVPNAKEHTVLMRLTFDRLQQGCSYAFPTRILLRTEEITSIHYRITADELDKVVEDELVALSVVKR